MQDRIHPTTISDQMSPAALSYLWRVAHLSSPMLGFRTVSENPSTLIINESWAGLLWIEGTCCEMDLVRYLLPHA